MTETIRDQAERAAVSVEPVPLLVSQNAARALLEVLNLHKPIAGSSDGILPPLCAGCSAEVAADVPWPCATHRAIARGYGGCLSTEPLMEAMAMGTHPFGRDCSALCLSTELERLGRRS